MYSRYLLLFFKVGILLLKFNIFINFLLNIAKTNNHIIIINIKAILYSFKL